MCILNIGINVNSGAEWDGVGWRAEFSKNAKHSTTMAMLCECECECVCSSECCAIKYFCRCHSICVLAGMCGGCGRFDCQMDPDPDALQFARSANQQSEMQTHISASHRQSVRWTNKWYTIHIWSVYRRREWIAYVRSFLLLGDGTLKKWADTHTLTHCPAMYWSFWCYVMVISAYIRNVVAVFSVTFSEFSSLLLSSWVYLHTY